MSDLLLGFFLVWIYGDPEWVLILGLIIPVLSKVSFLMLDGW